jgi:hypothetical protein
LCITGFAFGTSAANLAIPAGTIGTITEVAGFGSFLRIDFGAALNPSKLIQQQDLNQLEVLQDLVSKDVCLYDTCPVHCCLSSLLICFSFFLSLVQIASAAAVTAAAGAGRETGDEVTNGK